MSGERPDGCSCGWVSGNTGERVLCSVHEAAAYQSWSARLARQAAIRHQSESLARLQQDAAEADELARLEAEVRALEAASAPAMPDAKPGPGHIVTRAVVEAKRSELEAAGMDHGYGSLAAALGVHESTIRRRLKGD